MFEAWALFSRFIERNIPKANEITLKHEDQSLDIISQYTVRVPVPELKIKILKSILEQCDRLGQAIVFVWKRVHARALHKQLNDDGFKVRPKKISPWQKI